MAETVKVGILQRVKPFFDSIFKSKDLIVVLFVIAILAIIIVPLPSVLLDFFLTVSIAMSVLLLLISLYIPKPTDFTTFPLLILLLTLFRLSLNVSTTRMILSEGHNGPEAVSELIASFGEFVVGGNFVIGIIMFGILVIINLQVITSGSTRVAEVAARFTLDAMPGKQMAIDADMNAGLIDEKEAKERREGLQAEADFYGSMDGAVKFVKGDASAGLMITFINVIGGFLIGVFQHDMELAEAASTFTLLTIGDGLVSILPGLITSTATGITVTRSSKEDEEAADFASSIIDQLISDYKVLAIVGFILVLFAMIPGLPTLALGFVGGLFLFLAYSMKAQSDGRDTFAFFSRTSKDEPPKPGQPPQQRAKATKGAEAEAEQRIQEAPKKSPEEIAKQEDEALGEILKIEILELDLGYQLIKLADANQGGDLLERVRGMRRKMASDYGFLMPKVRIRDNLHLKATGYQILLKGNEVGAGEVEPEKFLAMNSGMVTDELEGIPTKEPAFGLDAIWIDINQKDEAIIRGYTVVDPATVISTHMSELVKKYAKELLTRQEVHHLVEKISKDYPIIAEDVKKSATIGLIQQVLKALLHERVPIRDMLTILETIADIAPLVGGNVDIIVEQVRARLARVITASFKDGDGTLKLLTFNAQSEQYLLDRLKDQQGQRTLLLNVNETNRLVQEISDQAALVLQKGISPVVMIVDPLLRKVLADKMEQFGLDVVMLSHAEIDPASRFEVLGTVEINF